MQAGSPLWKLRKRHNGWPWSYPGLMLTIILVIVAYIDYSNDTPLLIVGRHPLWMLAFVPSFAGTFLQWRRCRTQNRRAAALGNLICPHCCYLLDGTRNPIRCPECGGSFTAEDLAWFWKS